MPGHGGQVSDVLTPAAPAPGVRIGAFELISPLGTRRPALTWRAVERATGVSCVVKLAAAGAKERLAREAVALRRVDDAGVPALLADESAGDPPHIGMELVDGAELEQVLAEGLRAAEVASLLAALTATLGKLHVSGFIHGDVQPANVIVRPDGRPVLIDFGSARIVPDEAGAHASIVEVTPGYAAPECRRAGERVGPAADLYAIGAIGYRALTGRVRSAGAAPLTESAGAGPFALRAVLDWALEASPDARPESAAELEAALLGSAAAGPQTIRVRRLLEHPSDASTVSPEASPRPRAGRRRRFAVTALAAAALAPAIWFGADAWIERTRLDWSVDPAGGGHARTIADALSRARSGALIRIAPGTYREKLEIKRDVALLGTGDAGAMPVIEGGYGTCLTVRAAAVQIVGLALRNYSKAPCVELAGGELAIEAGGGTKVRATLPVRRSEGD
jgi:hypothetical protein